MMRTLLLGSALLFTACAATEPSSADIGFAASVPAESAPVADPEPGTVAEPVEAPAAAEEIVEVAPQAPVFSGVKARLDAVGSTFMAAAEVVLRLQVEAIEDGAVVPASLFDGLAFDVSCGEASGPAILEAGSAGVVHLAKGTTIVRTIALPAARFTPDLAAAGIATVALQWPGLTGANCVFDVVPDVSQLDIADLDLEKTRVVLVTSLGEMTLSFRPDKAPRHVVNFLELAKKGFYDGTKFHRVIRGFMIQGGDPNTKDDSRRDLWGQGGPGYRVDAEFNDIRHVRGVLSMAREPDPDSAGSQFFIMHGEAGHLDGQYSAFGHLESGADTLDAIANVPVQKGGSAPLEPVVLRSVVILPVLKAK